MLTQSFKVRYGETGFNNRVPVWVLQNYAQQAAALDAHSISAGWEDLSKHGVTWVLIKIQFKITGVIEGLQTVNVKTWHVLSDKIKSRRDFVFYDEQGNEIATAVSWWLVLDLETRKIVRTPKQILDGSGNRVMALKETELKEPHFENALPLTEIAMVSRLEDIDMNGHVNNVHFTAWAFEGVPREIRRNQTLSDIVINFKAEVLADEKIIIKTYASSKSSFWHLLIRDSDGKEIAAAYTLWS
ncbi:acyl-[acyl-carrier-protein] thioesterase [Endomicrobium proavitum]|uniref:Putative Acyl-ACP thioesterase n=1 Tax=Endomicrobium proavitum TaxID=1408281 RepID=A0A0G3WL39_9BACT|nr:acyl-ACP thioesterase domain-containing protein [Endomicrobium proavitum]AKL98600.1 putative Acyl-ACP thioesterase [Endomicrobium proavitum]